MTKSDYFLRKRQSRNWLRDLLSLSNIKILIENLTDLIVPRRAWPRVCQCAHPGIPAEALVVSGNAELLAREAAALDAGAGVHGGGGEG